MKNVFLAAAVFGFSAMTMAQTLLTPSLNMEGTFGKKSLAIVRGVKTNKECSTHRGVMRKGRCVVASSEDSLSLLGLNDGTYLVKIKTRTVGNHECSYDGLATEINKVQLVSTQGACEMTIGFENQSTAWVETNGLCEEVAECGNNVSLKLNGLKRMPVKAMTQTKK